MAVHTTLTSLFTSIANAIRAKTGGSDPIVADNFPDAIAKISTGIDTSDATATAADLLSGKTAYGVSGKITGSMPGVEAATPAITVSSGGLITATANQSAGYVAKSTKSATRQLDVQGAQTITPGTSDKTIPSDRYLTGTQTIRGDANLVAGNIKSGVSIFGVGGTYEGSGGRIVYAKLGDNLFNYESGSLFQIKKSAMSGVPDGWKVAFLSIGFDGGSAYTGSGIIFYDSDGQYKIGLNGPYNGLLVTDLDAGIVPINWYISGNFINCEMDGNKAPRAFYMMGSPYSFFVY